VPFFAAARFTISAPPKFFSDVFQNFCAGLRRLHAQTRCHISSSDVYFSRACALKEIFARPAP